MVAAEERKIAERRNHAKSGNSDSEKTVDAKDSKKAEKDS